MKSLVSNVSIDMCVMKSLVSNVPPPQSLLVIIKTVKDLADDLEMRLNQYSLNEKEYAILV